jgi:hypothetical protein
MRLSVHAVFIALGLALLIATPSLACEGRARPGEVVAGPVLAVPAAGLICVALGPTPASWVAVRLEGGPPLERKVLMAATFAKRVECVMHGAGMGTCHIDGVDIASLGRSPTVQQASVDWR